jgi:L,D-transpeptidase catalytic domain
MRARDLLYGLSAALAAGVLLAALALVPSAGAGAPDLSGSVRLSDERTFTRWAHADEVVPVREWPKPNAAVIDSLSLSTEDGLPEVYPLLHAWTDVSGDDWLQIRIPMRPRAQIGWVEASALSAAQLVRTRLVVNRRSLRATLYRGGRRVWRSPIGVGKPSTPTPGGRFWIRERLRSSPGGPYGPWAFGTSAYSRLSDWPGGGVVGIHGTNQPDLIPGRPSHGCIRVPNRAIRRLERLMPIGTPILIR